MIIMKNEVVSSGSIEMKIGGVSIQLQFSDKEESGMKDRVINILFDAYEKKRLGETIEKSDEKSK